MAVLESRNTTHKDALRQFIRHPTDIPIELERSQGNMALSSHHHAPTLPMNNVSRGGVSCITTQSYTPNDIVQVRIPFVIPEFSCSAQVVWCRQFTADLYEVGLSFLKSEDAFAARMVEQICHIEQYKRQTYAKEGRLLTGEEAASEWIDSYAGSFPPVEGFHS
ncbi:PilZ domain-containing protein [Allohahella sp. A8]|uniref:PilZ domain-containing protein n=1 Tax=Allohahella sp. A8 TaxID=3141461 RepID=UPI002697562A